MVSLKLKSKDLENKLGDMINGKNKSIKPQYDDTDKSSPPSKKNQYVVGDIKKYSDFIDLLSKKQNSWIIENENFITYGMKVINELSNDLKNYKDNEVIKENHIRKISFIYKRIYYAFDDASKKNFMTMKKFFVDNRSIIKRIMSYIFDNQKKKDFDFTISSKYSDLNKKVNLINDNYNFLLLKNLSGLNTEALLLLDDEKSGEIKTANELVNKNIESRFDKLKSFVNLNYSFLDMILNTQFYTLYIIKIIRCLFNYVALFLATRIFIPIYEEAVYDQKKNPPSLAKFLLIFLALDLSLNTFLIVVLFLLKFIFKSDNNIFPIDNDLFTKYGIDYGASTLVILLIGLLLSRIITKKKSFGYKLEGSRTIRSYESMMWNMSIVINMIPFFLIN